MFYILGSFSFVLFFAARRKKKRQIKFLRTPTIFIIFGCRLKYYISVLMERERRKQAENFCTKINFNEKTFSRSFVELNYNRLLDSF